jgi:ATP-dependent Zn protease
MKRTRKQRKTTAYHEAGHAVIGRVLALPCGAATIKPDFNNGIAGTSITPGPYVCEAELEKRGKMRLHRDAIWHARIMVSMAGAEAEIELLGSKALGDGEDRLEIQKIVSEFCRVDFWNKLEPRLRAMTRMLVRRHKPRIERVAEALLAKTTLSAKALDKLVGRSVDDVKANVPDLLLRHQQRTGIKPSR